MRTRRHAHGRGLDLRSRPAAARFLFRQKAGPLRPREAWAGGAPLNSATGMASLRSVVLRPWFRELVLGSERLSSPRAGQLLQVSAPQPPQGPETRVGHQGGGIDARRRRQVLQEAGVPGPSHAPDTSDVGAALLVSDGTHSVRCLVTREALNASDW